MSARLSRLVSANVLRGLAMAAAAGVFLALTDAFGSNAALPLRLAYWVSLMILAGLWAHLCVGWVERLPWMRGPWPVRFATLVLAIGLPLTLVIWGVTGWMFGVGGYSLAVLPGFLWRVLLITAAMTALALATERKPATPAKAAAGEAPRFPERLPPRLRGATIFAVQAEDHYLRVHTDRGSDLILMRLSDAIAELDGLDGAQTHRSWWVARQAVRKVARGDGRAVLTLEGGLAAPVSRRYARALRDAGWY